MKEFELISKIIPGLPGNASTLLGAGDDCAILDLGIPERWLLFKTDAVVQDVHFTQDTAPERIGHKALARCLSDIAAMGGDPVSALITLGLPTGYSPDWVIRVYDGMRLLAQKYKVSISGGETTSTPQGLFISVSMVGTVPVSRCIRRSGALPGDAIWVTGTLGGSIAGKHLDFEPRLIEAAWLASHFSIHAMMDISDGLAGDLRHLLTASQCGAELMSEFIPISIKAMKACSGPQTCRTPLMSALTDGEDFELVFTTAPRDAVALKDAWRERFPETRISCVGKITAEIGLRVREKSRVLDLTAHGYDHFA